MAELVEILMYLLLGILAISKREQARLSKYLSFGKKNPGQFFIRRSGKNMTEHVVDFSKDGLTVGDKTFVKNQDRIYNTGGIAWAVANEGSTELIDLDMQARSQEFDIACPKCNVPINVTCPDCNTKFDKIQSSTTLPLINPKTYHDIVAGALDWGRKIEQSFRENRVLIALLVVGILVAIAIFFILQIQQGINSIQAEQALQRSSMQAIQNVTKAIK